MRGENEKMGKNKDRAKKRKKPLMEIGICFFPTHHTEEKNLPAPGERLHMPGINSQIPEGEENTKIIFEGQSRPCCFKAGDGRKRSPRRARHARRPGIGFFFLFFFSRFPCF